MAIKNFIPTVWSENLLTALDQQYIAVANCNRDFEGEITEKGSVVKICGLNSINIGDYKKNTDMETPQELSDYVKELSVNQAKYFNFLIDDIDKAQCSPKLMDYAVRAAASAIANETDKFIYTLHSQASVSKAFYEISESNILDVILEARETLFQHGVVNPSDLVLEVSPNIASMILKAKIQLSDNNTQALENGCIGNIGGVKVFVTNNIAYENSGPEEYYYCLMRTKRAVAFAEQFSEIVAYRPEKRFAEAIKGLHLYGAKVVYPDEMYCMQFVFSA